MSTERTTSTNGIANAQVNPSQRTTSTNVSQRTNSQITSSQVNPVRCNFQCAYMLFSVRMTHPRLNFQYVSVWSGLHYIFNTTFSKVWVKLISFLGEPNFQTYYQKFQHASHFIFVIFRPCPSEVGVGFHLYRSVHVLTCRTATVDVRLHTCSHVFTLHPEAWCLYSFILLGTHGRGDGTINRMSTSKLSNNQIMGVRISSTKPSNSKLSNVSKISLFDFFNS